MTTLYVSSTSSSEYNAILSKALPLGFIDFCPSSINIQSNFLSQEKVDGTIDSLYQNRWKWLAGSSKSLNISGTNAPPSGIYQAPTGFIHHVNDGTPVSAKEQIFVLVHNYEWIITYTND